MTHDFIVVLDSGLSFEPAMEVQEWKIEDNVLYLYFSPEEFIAYPLAIVRSFGRGKTKGE